MSFSSPNHFPCQFCQNVVDGNKPFKNLSAENDGQIVSRLGRLLQNSFCKHGNGANYPPAATNELWDTFSLLTAISEAN